VDDVHPKTKEHSNNLFPRITPQLGWTDEAEAPPPEWWIGEKPGWQAPQLALDEDWVLGLDGDPGPGDEWPTYSAD
jgi:hypothetical protein